jgi:Uma2 family endonuclease
VPPGDKDGAGQGFAMFRSTGLQPAGSRRYGEPMSDQTPGGGVPARLTSGRYLALVDEGVLGPDDRVELLEGIIVAKEPHTPWHASGVRGVFDTLVAALGSRALVTQQSPFVVGRRSVPEPDVFVVPGRWQDYLRQHPGTAHLVVEVSDTSLVQDRITKSGIYAAAGVPEYWIVSRRGDHVVVASQPRARTRGYAVVRVARRGEAITLAAFPDVTLAVDDLLSPADESVD